MSTTVRRFINVHILNIYFLLCSFSVSVLTGTISDRGRHVLLSSAMIRQHAC
jgi:hypothetical protein